jgi:hypothetical protein
VRENCTHGVKRRGLETERKPPRQSPTLLSDAVKVGRALRIGCRERIASRVVVQVISGLGVGTRLAMISPRRRGARSGRSGAGSALVGRSAGLDLHVPVH